MDRIAERRMAKTQSHLLLTAREAGRYIFPCAHPLPPETCHWLMTMDHDWGIGLAPSSELEVKKKRRGAGEAEGNRQKKKTNGLNQNWVLLCSHT